MLTSQLVQVTPSRPMLQPCSSHAGDERASTSGRDLSSPVKWHPAHSLSQRSGQKGLQHQQIGTYLLSVLPASLLALPVLFGANMSQASQQPYFIAQALGVMATIVAVHEAGHFTAARVQGIHVTKFAIGFGPALVQFTRGEVEYSLRAIPLGGYVAFPDDDVASPYPADDPNLLKNRSIPERAAVISAGVIANIVFAYAVLLLQVATVGKAETAYLAGVRMPNVDASSVASRGGLRSGDIIMRVGDQTISSAPNQVSLVVNAIQAHPSQPLAFTVLRGEAPPLVIDVVPEAGKDGRGRIGVSLTPNSYINHVRGASPREAFTIAGNEFVRLASTVLTGLKTIVTNFGSVAGQVSGPVAIVAAGADIARTDAAGLFQFCAIVNINLAVVNMLPLPALDGGYLMLLMLEAIRGKKLPEKLEQGFMASGFLLLMAMGVSLVVKDTIGLIPL